MTKAGRVVILVDSLCLVSIFDVLDLLDLHRVINQRLGVRMRLCCGRRRFFDDRASHRVVTANHCRRTRWKNSILHRFQLSLRRFEGQLRHSRNNVFRV
jgi:hypothetical protein